MKACDLYGTWYARAGRYVSRKSSFSYRTHTCGELSERNIGETVTLCGWTRKKRYVCVFQLFHHHIACYWPHPLPIRVLGGGMNIAFIPLGDSTGMMQLTCDMQRWKDLLSDVSSECVVMATGIVKARPEKDQNHNMSTGDSFSLSACVGMVTSQSQYR